MIFEDNQNEDNHQKSFFFLKQKLHLEIFLKYENKFKLLLNFFFLEKKVDREMILTSKSVKYKNKNIKLK